MSWSDDMRCLYCDGKLPLYRKITHGQFCSTAHRKAYWQEQERLAVERLHQTHNSLKALRPPAPVESILGRDPGEAELSGFVPAVLYPQSQGAPRMLVADPLAYDMERRPGILEWIVPERPEMSAPAGGMIGLLQDWSSRAIADNGLRRSRTVEPAAKMVSLLAVRPHLELALERGAGDKAVRAAVAAPPPKAGRVAMELRVSADGSPRPGPQQYPSRMPRPTQFLDLPLAPATPEIASVKMPPPVAEGLFSLRHTFQIAAQPAAIPPCQALRQMLAAEWPAPALPVATLPDRLVVKAVGLPGLAGATAWHAKTDATNFVAQAERSIHAAAEPLSSALPLATLPIHSVVKAAGFAELAGATTWVASKTLGSKTLPAPAAQPALAAAEPLASSLPPALLPDLRVVKAVGLPDLAGAVPLAGYKLLAAQAAAPINLPSGTLRALTLAATPEPLQVALALPRRRPGLAMGKGSRYPIQVRTSGVLAQEVGPMDFPRLPSDVPALPPPALATPGSRLDAMVPEPRGLVSLNVKFGPPATKPVAALLSNVATIPQPLRTEPIRPSSRLEPLDAKPFADLLQPQVVGLAEPVTPAEKVHAWTRAAGFWKLAPRDLKILAFAIPALLALAFHRELPKVRLAATPPSTGELSKNFKTVVNTQWTNVRQAVVDRAAVALDEDFRSGLDDWASRSDATADWSFDATGFVRPGPLALYRPSMNLTDYQVQFLGLIDKKALSWVVRAADFDNYYVLKLVVLKAGPRTTVGLTRYAVINGKAVDRVDTVVPMEAQPDTLYRVNLQLDGDDFSLGIQGQMVDSWTEPRLPRGGIGFFTSRGEESRIRWVALTHQYDMLGRLCAYLAPYESPTTNGSW